jgi:hypothetical protein
MNNIFTTIRSPSPVPSLSLFTPQTLNQAEKTGDLDIDTNILDLYPDPRHFVDFLRIIDREEVASSLFVRFLEGYLTQKQLLESERKPAE